MQVTTQAVRGDSLALITGVGGPLEAVTAVPLKAPFSMTDLKTWADIVGPPDVRATFTGSAPILIVWSDPAIAPNRQPFQESQLLLWICTAAPSAQEDIYGVAYYLAGSPNVLLAVDVFDAPVAIKLVGDSVQWIATAP